MYKTFTITITNYLTQQAFMKKILILLLLSHIANLSFSQKIGSNFLIPTNLKNGDLIFQNLDCGALCDAIESVTEGYKGIPLSHVGIIEIKKKRILIIEAIGSKVHKTPIDIFLKRIVDSLGRPKIIIGRLLPNYAKLLPKALLFCNKKINVPYDDAFLPNNGKYYCSELLYDAFKYANQGIPFFALFPMTYKNKITSNFFKAWVDYFEALKMTIPEGIDGCNPASIANDVKIEIFYK